MVNKATKVMAGVLILLGCVSAASAQDGVIRGRVGVSQNNFSSLYSGGPMKSDYKSLNTGITYIQATGWYADLALKNSMSAKWSLNGFGNDSNNGLQIGSGNDPYVRKDITLTVGKALDGGIQLFGGYQQANSTIDMGPLFPTRAHYKEEFNVKGYFVGIGKTFAMPVGSVNLNGALGQMKGRLLAGNENWYESDTGTGFSLGATYSYPLAEKTTLSLEYKTQAYKYKISSGPSTGGDDKIQVFGANISYQF
jgi:hypothetical protein